MTTMTNIEKALKDLRAGRFCLIYDNDRRERETDLMIASQFTTHEAVRRLRKDAGGLICTTVPYFFHEKIEMPFLTDLYARANDYYKVLKALVANDIPYDAKSSFSLTINHRKTFTGVTDKDRALTISEFAKLLQRSVDAGPDEVLADFGRNFRTPGHVPLLNTSKELLSRREGHTELATAMIIMAGLAPSATICEMMGDNGDARSKDRAKVYAEKHDLAFLTGADVIEAWKGWGRTKTRK
jgi:3,4-dihydroxy 2-butanone 4-phosphate synthase